MNATDDDAVPVAALRSRHNKAQYRIGILEQKLERAESDLSAAREEIAELRKVLKPFAKFDTSGFGEMIEAVPPDPMRADRRIEPMCAEDFRRAREALRSSRTKGEAL